MKKVYFCFFILFMMGACSHQQHKAAVVGDSGKQQTADEDTTIKGSLTKNGKIVITDPAFEKNSAEMKKETEKPIKEVADYLKENMDVTMNVVCYTGDDGTPAQCVDLSRKRAKTVSDKLGSYGVDTNRVKIEGNGYDATNGSERIEIMIEK